MDELGRFIARKLKEARNNPSPPPQTLQERRSESLLSSEMEEGPMARNPLLGPQEV